MRILTPTLFGCLLLLISLSSDVFAHFGAVIPSAEAIDNGDSGVISLEVAFLHPMEQHYMQMEHPKRFGVMARDSVVDISNTLKPVNTPGGQSWSAEYRIRRPGDHTFFVEPQPYWEPAEDVFIIHYTKVCVNGFGLEQGWDKPIGLETEIIPLTRPYGLWTGNLFTGQVLQDGKPVPHAEIEVEFLNTAPKTGKPVTPPNSTFITQVLKADANGIFSYAMPKEGWWGFAALSEAERTMKHEGKDKNIEIGAVYWVRTRDMN